LRIFCKNSLSPSVVLLEIYTNNFTNYALMFMAVNGKIKIINWDLIEREEV